MEQSFDQKSSAQLQTPLKRRPRILIVEDDVTMEPLWSYVIEAAAPGSSVKWVTSEEAAERLIERRIHASEKFDLIIADVFLTGSRTGIDLWKRYAEETSLFLLMSVMSPQKFAKLLGDGEPTPFYVQKPLDPRVCIEVLGSMLAFQHPC